MRLASLPLLAVILAATTAHATPQRAASGPLPEIVLYTMGKGDVVWEKFGHAALCVEYPSASQGQSACYNYGTTDFSQPVSVGWGFLRGEGLFWVSVTAPQTMIRRYISYNRTLWRQVLPLPADQVLAIAARLEHDLLPENRYYTYHHFYDNCTTRIRDIIDEATQGQLRRDTAHAVGPTFRDYARDGLAQDVPLLLLMDHVMGRGADKQPDLWEAMFLPDILRDHVRERLGAEPVMVYERRGPPFGEVGSGGRGWLVLFALLLALPIALTRRLGRFERAGMAVAVVPLFLFGLILWSLAALTSVQEFRHNEALLLYLPTDLALLFIRPSRRRLYARVRVAVLLLVAALLLAGVFAQPLWLPLLMVLLPMAAVAWPPRAATLDERSGESGNAKRSPRRRRKRGR